MLGYEKDLFAFDLFIYLFIYIMLCGLASEI